MECAAPSSFLVMLPLEAFSGCRFRERRDRPLCHLMVRQQTWQESQNSDQSPLDCRCGNRRAISKPGACARRHVQAIQAATICSGGRYASPLNKTAQTMRAILLANATVATCLRLHVTRLVSH